MRLNEFITSVLDVPFVSGGRDRTGLDCWGLIRLAYLDVLGVELPSYSDEQYEASDRRKARSLIEAADMSTWELVERGYDMDCMLLDIGGYVCHVGLLVDAGRSILHTEKRMGVAVERLGVRPWDDTHRKRLQGPFRYARTRA